MKYVYSFLLCFCITSFFAQNQSFKIGDKYQGGTVVYLFNEGDSQYGKYEGIIMADTLIANQQWGCKGIQVIPLSQLSTSSKIGSAFSNNELLLSNCKDGVGAFCDGIKLDCIKGWFLPTAKELFVIFDYCTKLNIPIQTGKYLTSVDANILDAIIVNNQNMGGRNIYSMTTQRKEFLGTILPIKYFNSKAPSVSSLWISSLIYGSEIVNINNSISIDIQYDGGNGAFFEKIEVKSNGILGLTANISQGTLNVGRGFLKCNIDGMNNKLGKAFFDFSIGGQCFTYVLDITENEARFKSINCGPIIGSIYALDSIKDFTLSIDYSGGNGGTFSEFIVKSNKVEGLSLTINGDTASFGQGSILCNLSGITNTSGIAEFIIKVGDKNCNLSIKVEKSQAKVIALSCNDAKLNEKLVIGSAVWPNEKIIFQNEDKVNNVTFSLPYKGGNGGSYDSLILFSKGVYPNRTALLKSGTLNNGDGELIFSLIGEISQAEALAFPIEFGGNKGVIELEIYNVIWEPKNLDVDKFRNGDTIYNAKSNEEWVKAGKDGKPAWCNYKNDSINGSIYGKLYNWYAINDPRGLAPKGSHIATAEEWHFLAICLGGNDAYSAEVVQKTVGQLKSTNYWVANDGITNKFGNNEIGFGALPAGKRTQEGYFQKLNNEAGWWTLSFCRENIEHNTNPIALVITSDKMPFYSMCSNKTIGMSVRCVKD